MTALPLCGKMDSGVTNSVTFQSYSPHSVPYNSLRKKVPTMLTPNQTVYYTSSLLVQEATFIRYEGDFCILSTPMGNLKIRKSRVFTKDEAAEQGLLDRVKAV